MTGMNIKKSIKSIFLAPLLLISTSSYAASTTALLDVIVSGGTFDGVTGSGSLTWDENDVSGASTTLDVGLAPFTLNSGKFLIDLTIFGQNFTGADASNPSTLSFTNNDPSQLIYTVESGINQAGIDSFSFVGGLTFDGIGIGGGTKPLKVYVSTVETSVVPVPASVWLFISGLLGLVGMQRRKS